MTTPDCIALAATFVISANLIRLIILAIILRRINLVVDDLIEIGDQLADGDHPRTVVFYTGVVVDLQCVRRRLLAAEPWERMFNPDSVVTPVAAYLKTVSSMIRIIIAEAAGYGIDLPEVDPEVFDTSIADS